MTQGVLLDPTTGVDVAVDAVQRARQAGADEAQAVHIYREMFEVNYGRTEVTLVRSTVSDDVSLTVFVGGRRGESSLTGRSHDLVDDAARQAVAAAEAGVPDDANRLATGTSSELVELGHREPDKEAMVDTVLRHLQYMAEAYPLVCIDRSHYLFSSTWRSFANSTGLTRQERRGGYTSVAVFSGKDGVRTTSFNYTSATAVDPFADLLDAATHRALIEATVRSFDPEPVPETFVGDVIFTPDSLPTLLDPLARAIGGYALMTNTSPFADALGTTIAAPSFTLANRPRSPLFPLASTFDGSGIPAEDRAVVRDGVLDDFLIDWYTSHKLGRPMTAGVQAFEVSPGDQTFDEIVAGTERGIVLGRFSGGTPNRNLDFSGVAKNSFYVSEGKIRHPVAETMVAGNFSDLLRGVRAISSEVVNFGGGAYPYLAAPGVTISSNR